MDNLRLLQLKEVDMLKDTLSFFEKYGLRYYAMSGTLLGAVRHKGFIPWDDDIDLAMPRPDYNRLIAIAENTAEIKLRYYGNDKGYGHYFAKIESDKIKVVIKNNATGEEQKASSWISVFPFDGMPNNKIIRKIHQFRILFFRMLYVMSRFDDIANLKKKNRSFIERVLIFLTQKLHLQKIISRDYTFKKIDRILQKYDYDRSELVVDAMGAYKFKEMFPRKWFGKGKVYDFEGVNLIGPDVYDPMLTQLYGDYMTPVDESERGGHNMVDITFVD